MADTQLSAMTASSGVTGTDLFYADNGGDVKVTGAQLKTFTSVSPTLVTPTLGVATATSLNGNTFTTGTYTLTGSAGKVLTFSNTLTLNGTDSTVMTFPATSATIARTDAANTFTGTQTVGALVATTVNGNTITTGTFTLTGTAAKTLTFSNSLTLAGTDATTMTFPPASASIGYLGLPQNSQSAAYTTVLADAGKHVLHPTADNNARTFTIAANASVAYAVGTAITFINQINTVTIAITSDTLTLMGAGTTGSRTLAANGIATAVKVSTTGWVISGTGLT